MRRIAPVYLPAALILAIALLSPAHSSPRGLSKALLAAADTDTVRNVWVFFDDRPGSGIQTRVSERAMQRRHQAKYRPGADDRPVHRPYINEVQRLGGRLRHEFPWENAASFSVHASRLSAIAALPFVKSVEPVRVYAGAKPALNGLSKSPAGPAAVDAGDPGYGWHMNMVNIPMAHEYIKMKELGNPGEGAYLAFFDGGFRFDHKALLRAKDSGRIAAGWDFVDNDSTVYDPDSVASDSLHRYHQNDKHGTQTLALAAGYHPGYYIGGAWGAGFAVARTEDDGVESRIEEDNWAAAAVWADSLGADIISSSLGYLDGFTDSTENYSSHDMDGKTAVISLAAAGAVRRGMIVVNSAGNESVNAGSAQTTATLTAPADVDSVTTVGAVDRNRLLAGFSGVGPTADGRMKPDLTAPGVNVPLPNVYSSDRASYTAANGTSFSAPIVSAIFALVLQVHPGISAGSARARVYASCKFATRQTFPDSKHGHGIPNALRAIMDDDEVFVRIVDTNGLAVSGAQVRIGQNAYTASESGSLLFRAKTTDLPLELKISYRGSQAGTYTIGSLPFEGLIDIAVKREEGLKTLPSVVRRSSVVRGKYYFPAANISNPAVAMVHTLNGRKIWEEKISLRPDGSADFVWDCRRNPGRLAAGVYFITVRHGNEQVSGRVIIAK
ncbi:MAG: S8 family serine peptidase [Chitinispirillia bacterium]|nr:S8 family serine peptidase [Chitinispirillia bacterium]MCL2241127.1 S8 family serine peptidase [Chitinispirillia bacterium]